MNERTAQYIVGAALSVALGLGLANDIRQSKAWAAQQVTRTITIHEMSDFPALKEAANKVCAGTHKLSDNAKATCDGRKPWPRVTKGGAFYNNGTGAEFNVLIRQQ